MAPPTVTVLSSGCPRLPLLPSVGVDWPSRSPFAMLALGLLRQQGAATSSPWAWTVLTPGLERTSFPAPAPWLHFDGPRISSIDCTTINRSESFANLATSVSLRPSENPWKGIHGASAMGYSWGGRAQIWGAFRPKTAAATSLHPATAALGTDSLSAHPKLAGTGFGDKQPGGQACRWR